MKKRLLRGLLISCAVLAAAITVILILGQKQQLNNYGDGGEIILSVNTLGERHKLTISFEGITALSILKNNFDVKSGSIISERVQCIENICSSGKYFWSFYINGEPGFDPARYIPQRGDTIEFKLIGDVENEMD